MFDFRELKTSKALLRNGLKSCAMISDTVGGANRLAVCGERWDLFGEEWLACDNPRSLIVIC